MIPSVASRARRLDAYGHALALGLIPNVTSSTSNRLAGAATTVVAIVIVAMVAIIIVAMVAVVIVSMVAIVIVSMVAVVIIAFVIFCCTYCNNH